MVMQARDPFGSTSIAEMELCFEDWSDEHRLEQEYEAKISFGKKFLAELKYDAYNMSDAQILAALAKELGDLPEDETDDDRDAPRHATRQRICV